MASESTALIEMQMAKLCNRDALTHSPPPSKASGTRAVVSAPPGSDRHVNGVMRLLRVSRLGGARGTFRRDLADSKRRSSHHADGLRPLANSGRSILRSARSGAPPPSGKSNRRRWTTVAFCGATEVH